MMGETFASRVAASLLVGVGMGELVAYSPEEYTRVAGTLLNHPERLALSRTLLGSGEIKLTLS